MGTRLTIPNAVLYYVLIIKAKYNRQVLHTSMKITRGKLGKILARKDMYIMKKKKVTT